MTSKPSLKLKLWKKNIFLTLLDLKTNHKIQFFHEKIGSSYLTFRKAYRVHIIEDRRDFQKIWIVSAHF